MADGGQHKEINGAQRLPELLKLERLGRGVSAFSPSPEVLDFLLDVAREDIVGLTDNETVQNIYAHNPETVWAIARSTDDREMFDNPDGFFCYLPLTEDGAQALLAGDFDTAHPPLEFICRQHESPAAVHLWAIHARNSLTASLALFAERLHLPRYRGKPLFTRAVNDTAEKLYLRFGFSYGAHWGKHYRSDLMVYYPDNALPAVAAPQAEAEVRPIYDRGSETGPGQMLDEKGRRVSITVVHSMDQLLHAFSVRAATFVAENHDPYDVEFDGNDLSSTHLVGYVDDEPVSTLRLRFFGTFAKFERLCVRPEYRRSTIFSKMVRAGLALCQKKGFTQLYGHSRHDLVALWRTFGFRPIEGRPPFLFGGDQYVEISRKLAPTDDPITLASSPLVIARPEGCWHKPGVLDQSSRQGHYKTGQNDPVLKRLSSHQRKKTAVSEAAHRGE